MTDYWDQGYNHFYDLFVDQQYRDPHTEATHRGLKGGDYLDFAHGGMAALEGWREVLTDRNGVIRYLEAK